MKTLQVKKVIVWLVLALVVMLVGYVVAIKYDVYMFATFHTNEARFAVEKYNDIQKAAGLMYKEGFATPVNVAK